MTPGLTVGVQYIADILALHAAPFSPAHCSSRQPRRARAVRCQASDAGAEDFAAPRRAVLGAGAALAAGSLLELGAPQRAGARVVSSDWELVCCQPAGSLSLTSLAACHSCVCSACLRAHGLQTSLFGDYVKVVFRDSRSWVRCPQQALSWPACSCSKNGYDEPVRECARA